MPPEEPPVGVRVPKIGPLDVRRCPFQEFYDVGDMVDVSPSCLEQGDHGASIGAGAHQDGFLDSSELPAEGPEGEIFIADGADELDVTDDGGSPALLLVNVDYLLEPCLPKWCQMLEWPRGGVLLAVLVRRQKSLNKIPSRLRVQNVDVRVPSFGLLIRCHFCCF